MAGRLLVCLLLCGCTTDLPVATRLSVTASAVNLVQNPGFESGAISWTQITSGGRSVSTTAFTGAKGAQILAAAANDRTVHQDVPVVGS